MKILLGLKMVNPSKVRLPIRQDFERFSNENYFVSVDVVEATSTNGNVYTKTLQWPSALNSFKQAGRYTCRAKRRKGGSVKENVWTITKVQAVETISHVAQGNAFEFECKSSYTPKQVQWFKNDVNQIEADENTVGINLLRNNRTLFISNVKASDGGKYLCIASNQFGETHSQQMLSVQSNLTNDFFFFRFAFFTE